MALDFPANPAKGTRYAPTGGPAYMFDGLVWVPASVGASLKAAVAPHCIVNRGVGQESLAEGVYGIIGQFTQNIGGFNGGALVGVSGLSVVIPKSGSYLVKNCTYYNPSAGSPSGRVGVTLNGTSMTNFVQMPASNTGSITQEAWTIRDMIAGDQIAYKIEMGGVVIYTNPGHSEVEMYRLPDGWEPTLGWEAA